MKHVVKIDDKFAIFKSYEQDDCKYARIIQETTDLKTAMKLAEDDVPVNNVVAGQISGLDIGMIKKVIRKTKMGRRAKP